MHLSSNFTIEVMGQRKRSIDEFVSKVEQEKNQGEDTQSEKSNQVEGDNNLFAGMMDVNKVLAEKQRKKVEKLKKVQMLSAKRQNMRPFVLFTGIKDNPIPYE